MPAANISKTIRCMPMKFSQVDGMVELNVRYTFVIATNCDVIITPSVRKIRIISSLKKFFFRIISCCSVNVHKLFYQ